MQGMDRHVQKSLCSEVLVVAALPFAVIVVLDILLR